MATLQKDQIANVYNTLDRTTKDMVGTMYDFYETHTLTKYNKNIVKLTNFQRNEKNGSIVNNAYTFPNMEPKEFVKKVSYFLTRAVENSYRDNITGIKTTTEKMIKDLCVENKLFINAKDFLKISYFYNNFPFIVDQEVDLDEHGIPYQNVVEQEDIIARFYTNLVKRNYEKNNLGFDRVEDYFAHIVDKFNWLDSFVRLDLEDYFELVDTLEIYDNNVPAQQMLDIVFGKDFYQSLQPDSQYTSSSVISYYNRLSSSEYSSILENLSNNLDVMEEANKNNQDTVYYLN